MKNRFVTALILSVSHASMEDSMAQYMEFVAKTGRNIKSLAETQARELRFLESNKRIAAHNELFQ